MSDLTTACTTCSTAVNTIFHPTTGTRQDEVISGDLFFQDQCFVRDEIRFLNAGRLIFAPHKPRENPDKREGEYYDTYYVICRKLTIIGGLAGGDNPDLKIRRNMITWKDRLQPAKTGPTFLADANNGPSFNGAWTNQGQGNDGMNGGNGDPGAKGNPGKTGLDAPRNVVVIALEVEVKPGSHLTIDWDGQDGGNGGRGQNGGKGGAAMNGRIGESDTTWPGTGCDRQPGNGGNGGNGGDGGPGGDGGNGGNAGNIIVISTKDNITTGAFVGGAINYVNDGGEPGRGGGSGTGGNGAPVGGFAGLPTSECSNASNGQGGVPGSPHPVPPPVDLDPNAGAGGTQGAAGAPPTFHEVQPGTCADLLPLPMIFDPPGLTPSHYCRGFSLPANGDGSISGQNFAQAIDVSASLAGVTPSIKFTSTDTQLDLNVQLAGNSGIGPCDLVFKRQFGPDQTLTGALTVGKFEVLGVTPSSGAKGNAVSVTINGNCFDPTALIQQVLISGLSINVLNVVVVDEHTVQCVFDIAALAASGPRDVTVKTGLFTHTLLNAFTVS